MKRCMQLLLVLLVLAPCARADEASKQAKVEELITVMHMDRMMGQMVDAITAQLEKSVEETPGMESMTPAQKKLVTDYETQSLKLVQDNIGWRAMEPEFVKVYAQTFSEEEIDGILAFYKSPAGQALLDKMPQLTTASMQIAQTRMEGIEPRLKALQDDFLKKMNDLPAPPPPPAVPPTKK